MSPGRGACRLGLFVDAAFRTDGDPQRVLCGSELLGFMRFAQRVGERFDRFALIARERLEGSGDRWTQLGPRVGLHSLPDYPNLRRIDRVVATFPATAARMWRALDELDAVWVAGASPLGLMMIAIAILRRRRVVLLIRQDTPRYFRSRLPSRLWTPMLAPAWVLDLCLRGLGKRLPTTVVGSELAGLYGAPRANVLDMRVTQLDEARLAPAPKDGEWADPVRLLTVGRIEPEKNPMLAVHTLAELNRSGGRSYSLTWAGEGRMAEELEETAGDLGVGGLLSLPGYVGLEDGLVELFADADAFMHISLTEGLPGVILEAMGSGLPIVATDVGSVSEALGGGEAGLLVPPRDRRALVEAVERLEREPELRASLASRALELARRATADTESERVAAFIAGAASA